MLPGVSGSSEPYHADEDRETKPEPFERI